MPSDAAAAAVAHVVDGSWSTTKTGDRPWQEMGRRRRRCYMLIIEEEVIIEKVYIYI